MRKLLPSIPEGTDVYSMFRFFSIMMFLVIAFIMIWNVRETRINRETGYHNRAVSCAVLRVKLEELQAQNIPDKVGQGVWGDSCQKPQVKELLDNAAR